MKTIKLLYIIALLICFSIVLEGQPGKGKLLIGGSSNFSLAMMNDKIFFGDESSDGGKNTILMFSPQAGYFVTDGLVAGFQIPVNLTSHSYNSSKLTRTSFSFAPLARYYFGESAFRPFLEASAGLGFLKYKVDSDSQSGNLFLWEIDAGMAMFIRDNIAVDLEFGYGSTTTRQKDTGTFDPDKEITSGFGLSIGFSFIL
jgi:hypothetical protein